MRVPNARDPGCKAEALRVEPAIDLLARALNAVGSRPDDVVVERVGVSPEGLPLVRVIGRSGDITEIMGASGLVVDEHDEFSGHPWCH